MPAPPPTQPPQSHRHRRRGRGRGGTRQQAKWRRPGRPRGGARNERTKGGSVTSARPKRERERDRRARESLLYRLSSLSPGILAHSPPLPLLSLLSLSLSLSFSPPEKGRESPTAIGQTRRQAPLSGAPEVAAEGCGSGNRGTRRAPPPPPPPPSNSAAGGTSEGAGFVPCSPRVPPPSPSSPPSSWRPATCAW